MRRGRSTYSECAHAAFECRARNPYQGRQQTQGLFLGEMYLDVLSLLFRSRIGYSFQVMCLVVLLMTPC